MSKALPPLPLLFLILICYVLANCSNPTTTETPTTAPIKEQVDSPSSILPAKPPSLTNLPSQPLQNIAASLQSFNWMPDTSRLKKVNIYPELDRKGLQYFNALPFYPIALEKSRWHRALQMSISDKHLKDKTILQGVSSIWGYFYKKKDAKNWVTDGVIEQWTFETAEQAAKGLAMIKEKGGFIYFNTQPYAAKIGNLLFIFQSRAAAFSYAQKPVFEQFVQANEKVVVD